MIAKYLPAHDEHYSKHQLTRVTRQLLRARDSLHSALGTSPSYLQLEEWTGFPERTIKEWCNNKGRPSAEFLMQLLERIPTQERHQLVDAACKVYPVLEHPRLKCDQTILSRLKGIVCNPGGLVFIQGGNDESRTFLLTALGHAFLSLTIRPHAVIGLDCHEPDWFVSLPRVNYFRNLFHAPELLQAARENWPKLQSRGAQLVVMNAMGVLTADFQRKIRALTASVPVVVAEAAQIKPSVLRRASAGPVHIVTLSNHPEDATGIHLVIQTA